MKTLVIIPAYNEQDNILKTLSDLKRYFPEGDVLAVNDCSQDHTAEILRDHHINHLNFVNNLGIGGAVQAGYIYAQRFGYDIAVQFDGDGQHMAQYLHDLTAPIESNDADVVIGSRFVEKEGFQSTHTRRTGIRILSWLIFVLSGVRVNDVTSGMRAVNRKYITAFARNYVQDYPEPEAIFFAGMDGARIKEVPVQMRARENGKSSISPLRSVYYMAKVSLALVLERLIFSRAGRK